MKASCLVSGQFFHYCGMVCLCDKNDQDGQPVRFARWEGPWFRFNYCGPDCEVQLLPFNSWDEVRQAEGLTTASIIEALLSISQLSAVENMAVRQAADRLVELSNAVKELHDLLHRVQCVFVPSQDKSGEANRAALKRWEVLARG